MVVDLNSTLQVFVKTSIKQHFSINKHLYVNNINHKYISVRECMVYYQSLPKQISFHV